MSILIRCTMIALALICLASAITAALAGAAVMGWIVGATVAGAGFLFECALADRRRKLDDEEDRLEMLLEACEETVSDLAEANELIARSLRTINQLKAAFAS